MDLLASYNENSETPAHQGSEEDFSQSVHDEYDLMMTQFVRAPATGKGDKCRQGSDASSSHSSGSSDSLDDGSEDESDQLAVRKKSSDYSSDSSSSSTSVKSEASKHSKESGKAAKRSSTSEKDHKASKVLDQKIVKGRSRSRSRSESKSKIRHHSRDRHRRTHNRGHRVHRNEQRRSGRSRSREGHLKRPSSRERHHRDRDSHRHRSRSHDGHRRHRHHRRRSSEKSRHRSRSGERQSSRSPKRKRVSRSPQMGRNTFGDSSASSKRSWHPTAGVKFSSGREGSAKTSFKDLVKQDFISMALQSSAGVVPGSTTTAIPSGSQLPRPVIQTAGANVMQARSALAANLLAQKQQQTAKTPEDVLKLQQEEFLKAQNRTKEQVEAQTGLQIPGYINPASVDLREYAHKLKNRKIIAQQFNEKKEDIRQNQFQAKRLLPGADKNQNEKFLRLLGGKKGLEKLKDFENDEVQKELEAETQRSQVINQDLMFQYDQSRTQTHLARGAGLGYSNTLYQPFG